MYWPAAIWVTPDNPATCAHVGRFVEDPSPNCPPALFPFVHTVPSANNTMNHAAELASSPVAMASTTGDGNTNSDCPNTDEYFAPDTSKFEPRTVKDPEFESDPDTAVTVTVDPGFAHGVPRSICVTAAPEPSVVADTGAKDTPVGPENDTAAPATPWPDEFLTTAVTGTAPEAAT